MSSRPSSVHVATIRRHIHATVDLEQRGETTTIATVTIVESVSAVIDTVDIDLNAPEWVEQTTGTTRWRSGTIDAGPDRAHALLAGRLGERISVLPPGPARREWAAQLVGHGMLALLLDGAT